MKTLDQYRKAWIAALDCVAALGLDAEAVGLGKRVGGKNWESEEIDLAAVVLALKIRDRVKSLEAEAIKHMLTVD